MQLKLYQPYEIELNYFTQYIYGTSVHARVMRQPALESEVLCFSTSNFQHDNVASGFPRAGHQPSSHRRNPHAQQILLFESPCSFYLLFSDESDNKGVDNFLPLLMDFVLDAIV